MEKAINNLEHGGNVHKLMAEGHVDPDKWLDFSANMNPVGAPDWLRSLINRELALTAHYPDPHCQELVSVISSHYRIPVDRIIPVNGTSELLAFLPLVLNRKKIVIPVPSYIDYKSVFDVHGFDISLLYLEPEEDFAIRPEILDSMLVGEDVVVLGNPANPSGSYIEQSALLDLIRSNPRTLFIIDEAFLDFVSENLSLGGKEENVITLNSLTKFYGIPGFRIGFGTVPEPYGKRLRAIMPCWNVNTLAQKIAVAALRDHEYQQLSRDKAALLAGSFRNALEEFNELQVFQSKANYFLLRFKDVRSAEELYSHCLRHNVIIRRCGNYEGLDDSYFRLAVKTQGENDQLISVFRKVLKTTKNHIEKHKKKSPSLMFQGTSSNAGKSILATALCRILLQDGLKVAPFKAQNMSLNSFVTRDGGEMGRAQVVQAQAARVEPDWRMNPILLKPNSHTGSQVIVNGKPVRNMNVSEYHKYKEQAWLSVKESYDQLSLQYDCIILEGAGSPGEVNLKKHDIVNMKMALYADSPVLLVGDIDRGGVYASFAGIMDVLEEWERNLVKGFVVNKFRGDESLLASAHEFITNHTDRDVLGVIPHISDLSVPQEDSVSMKDGFYQHGETGKNQVEIAVLDLPHISNFTDIDSLFYEPDVNIRIIKDLHDLKNPDCIILPGSKNVAGDLTYIYEKGFAEPLREYASQGKIVVGICGGYQMLGNKLKDPHGIETGMKDIEGLGLIDVDTVLMVEKTLVRSSGTHMESGLNVIGYEIHHGQTHGADNPVLRLDGGRYCGSSNGVGNVWGAYLHGIFDEDEFRRWFIDGLKRSKGLSTDGKILAPYNIDSSIDALADTVRDRLDMSRIYQMMGV